MTSPALIASHLESSLKEHRPWWVRFDDGYRIQVLGDDIQDALREAHREAGPKYSYQNMIEVRRV